MKRKLIFFIFLSMIAVLIFDNCSRSTVEEVSEVKSTDECPHLNEEEEKVDFIYPNPENNHCVTCHNGIEPIRDPESGMMQEIYDLAIKAGLTITNVLFVMEETRQQLQH